MKRHPTLVIASFCIIVAIAASLGLAHALSTQGLAHTAWPAFQHDNAHTGQSAYTGISASPQLLWQTPLLNACGHVGESGHGMSIGVDGSVYVSVNGCLIALDPVDGAIKWKGIPGNADSRSTPAVASDGTLYWGFANMFAAIARVAQMRQRIGIESTDSDLAHSLTR